MLIRRKSFLALSGAAAGAAFLAACGGDSSGSDKGSGNGSDAGGTSDAGGAEGAPARADADLVIWADEKKAQALEGPAKEWAGVQGLTVAVQTVANDLQSSFVTANQAGNGPDIVLGAHDWIGNLVQNGSISPVQLPADADTTLSPVAKTAVTFDGQTYGVPYAVETIALFANKELTDVPAPTTIEELVDAAKASGAEVLLSLPVGEQGDAYHMQPLYTSGGGYLFGTDTDGNPDPSDLGVGKDGSIAAAEKIGALGKDGVLSTSVTGENAIALFTDKKAAYLISGPWALSDINDSGIDFEMTAVPGFDGMDPAKPFAGVNAFYVASSGKNAGFAQQFLADVASKADIAEKMFETNQLPPANLELQKKLSGEYPNIVKIAEFAEKADPMPSIPEMAAIFGPLGQAQANIIGGADPASTMKSAGDEIASQIK